MRRRRPVFGMLGAMSLLILVASAPQDEPADPPDTGKKLVHIIPLLGNVDWTMHAFIQRATKTAIAVKPDLVVFEIDSPGGRIDAMEAIARRILQVEEAGIRNVAFVTPNNENPIGGAFSAASYLAMCAQKIYIYPGQLLHITIE